MWRSAHSSAPILTRIDMVSAPCTRTLAARATENVSPSSLALRIFEVIESEVPRDKARGRLLRALADRARLLKRDTYVLYFAARHPRTPWYAKVLAAAVVAYALSPFDLIPDFIPVLGYLDDMIIVPLGIAAVLRLVPADVLADCRAQAQTRMERRVSWAGAAFMLAVWLLIATWLVLVVRNLLS